jgi:adenylate cyclase
VTADLPENGREAMLGSADIFLFEGFRLDRGGLFRADDAGDGILVPLGSRALDLLGLLVEHQGELVSKDQIMEAVWPRTIVEENNLTVQIAALRRILDRDRTDGSCIQTVAGRGYRFIVPVTRGEPALRSLASGSLNGSGVSVSENAYWGSTVYITRRTAACARPLLRLPDKPSVAVLPFTNMTADPVQEVISDGIAEDIITALSRYPSLFVIARSSCFTYKNRVVDVRQVGRELGARYSVEGSLRKAGDRVRVTVQLTETETGKHAWAERYDRGLADIFALQDEIAREVTIAVVPAVADAELHRAMRKPTASLDAWGAYQRGRWHLGQFTAADSVLAEKYFERAIQLDEAFAGGYSGLAWARLYAASNFRTRALSEAQKLAEASARRAVALDVADAGAHASLAHALEFRGDLEGALAEAERALTLAPNLAEANEKLGSALTMSGRPGEGLAALRTSIELDPRGPRLRMRLHQLTVNRYISREYEAAVEAATHAIRFHPDYPHTYRWLVAALGQLGRTAEAKRAVMQATATAPTSFDIPRAPWMPADYDAHMVEGLGKAGWRG